MPRDSSATLTHEPWAAWLPSVYETGDRLAALVDRHKYILLAVFSAAYFADVLYRASRKLFWFDELLTVYAARLGTLESLWKGLMDGIDFNPPLFHIVTRLSERVLGENAIGARLPEMVGFWIFCLCLFRFVSLRSTALSGFIALLLPVVSLAHWYAYDARPYGMALGLCGIALVCWQQAADRSTGRFWYLAGMGVALACILLMHTNSFLIFVPLAAGETVRAVRRKRMDWPVWITMALASSAILVSVALLRSWRSVGIPTTYFAPTLNVISSSYFSFLKPAGYALFGWFVLAWLAPGKTSGPAPGRVPLGYELVAVLTFLTIPLLQYIAAKAAAAPTVARYSIYWITGPACLLGLVSANRTVVGIGTLLLLCFQAGVDALKFKVSDTLAEPSTGYLISTSMHDFGERYQWMRTSRDSQPIAFFSFVEALETSYYAPTDVKPRLIYVTRSRAEDLSNPRRESSDAIGLIMQRLQQCCGSGPPTAYYQDFAGSHDTFLLYGTRNDARHLQNLLSAGADLTLRNISQEYVLVQVTRGEKRPGTPF